MVEKKEGATTHCGTSAFACARERSRAARTPRGDALVVMTRAPQPGRTKTRMMPRLTPDQCACLHRALLSDLADVCRVLAPDVDVFVAYASPGEERAIRVAFDAPAVYFAQRGDSLGERLREAARTVLGRGYARCAIVGCDAPALDSSDVRQAFGALDGADVVLGPAEDGGYYLVAVSSVPAAVFDLAAYGHGAVLEQTLRAADDEGLTCALLRTHVDIDCWADVETLLARAEGDAALASLRTVAYLRDIAASEALRLRRAEGGAL